MGDEPDLDPDINKDFFENNVLQLDPSLLTENGMKCFERFFKAVNCREGKLVAKRRAYMMDDLELIGLDYLWRVSHAAFLKDVGICLMVSFVPGAKGSVMMSNVGLQYGDVTSNPRWDSIVEASLWLWSDIGCIGSLKL